MSESGKYSEVEFEVEEGTLRHRKTHVQRQTQDGLDYDEERECEILRNEIERIRKIRENMTPKNGAGRIDDGYNNSRINACDVTGEEFKIVCEELWVDFKKWTKHHENFTNPASVFCRAVIRMRFAILFVLLFAVC